ncbi:hypothetical protein TNCV_950691 [Trichonephila clavipes]|nr:hypothetical protein TNCV_950691 [Trichonephila clavipes]
MLNIPESEILEGFSDQGVIQLSQTYAHRLLNLQNYPLLSDENITKIKCPPLNLPEPLWKPNVSPNTPAVTTSSFSTQAQLLPSTSSIAAIVSEPQPPIPIPNNVLSTTNNMTTPIESYQSYPLPNPAPVFNPPPHLLRHLPSKIQKLGKEKGKKRVI